MALPALSYSLRRAIYASWHFSSFRRMQKKRKLTSNEYSYKQFDDTQSIFIHIPKAAGISVCKSIYGNLAAGHTSMSTYQYVFSRKDFDRYFKFTFVRNPWDRLFSAYSFLKKGGINNKDLKWSQINLSKYNSFERFVLDYLSETSIYEYIHFIPQTHLLSCYGKKLVLPIDYLGFYENLESDFQYVVKRLGKNCTLPYLNKTEGSKLTYQDAYSEDMIEKVRSLYLTDIQEFGYSFDNSSIETQILRRNEDFKL